jgi:hypothetical protein
MTHIYICIISVVPIDILTRKNKSPTKIILKSTFTCKFHGKGEKELRNAAEAQNGFSERDLLANFSETVMARL